MRISEAATGVGEQMADVGLAIQRAEEKTENMRARASAVEELEAAGTFDDLTSLGGGGTDDIDRQLAQVSTGSPGGPGAGEAAGRARPGSRRRRRPCARGEHAAEQPPAQDAR